MAEGNAPEKQDRLPRPQLTLAFKTIFSYTEGMALEPDQGGESPKKENSPQNPSNLSNGELPPIPKHVLDGRHTAVLTKTAKDLILHLLATREERGPDGGAGTLLVQARLDRFEDTFEDEILPGLLREYDGLEPESLHEESSYRDSYQDVSDDDVPEEAWKQTEASEGGDVGAAWHREKRFPHLQPKVLAGAALADGAHLLFVAMYDSKENHYITPSFGEVGLDFLHPSAVSQNHLIGLVVRIYSELGICDVESAEVYLAPPILELQLATIAYGDSTPWMEHCIKEIPMWEDAPPSDFDIIRSKIITEGPEKGNVTAFVLCSGHGRTPVDEEEAHDAGLPDKVDMGAFWCTFGVSPDGMPEMYRYVYFPPTLEQLEQTVADLLDLELLDESRATENDHEDALDTSKVPAEELQHDEALEREWNIDDVDFSPSSQIELFFENQGFSLASLPDREVDPLPEVIVRLALDRLDQIFPLNFSQTTPISICLFSNRARDEFIVGVPPKYLKDQFKASCDFLFLKCKLQPSEPGSHEVTTTFFGIAIQPEPFIDATTQLTSEDPQGSILLPIVLGAIKDELSVDENGLIDDETLDELIVSVGFPDTRDQKEDVYLEIHCLAALQQSNVEHLVSMKRYYDGGIVVVEENLPSSGVTHADSFLKETATVWAAQ